MSIQYIAKIDTNGSKDQFYLLNMLTIEDTLTAALAQHEYVNSDGAFIQNLGNHPRTITFKTFWFGDAVTPSEDIDPNYNNHYDFLADMSNSNVYHTLVHPVYGNLVGYINSLRTIRTDVQDYAEIDIDFVVKDIQNISFARPNFADMVVLQTSALNSIHANIANAIASSGYKDCLDKVVNFNQTLSSQISNVSQATQVFLGVADTVIGTWDSFLSTVTQPFSVLDNTISFINDVPARIMGSANNAMRRAVASMNNLQELPVTVTNNLIQYAALLGQTITSPTTENVILNMVLGNCNVVNILGAAQSGLVADNSNDKANQKVEGRKSFDPAGNRVLTISPVDVMSLQDLENMLYALNKYVQSIVVLNRANGQDVQYLLNMTNQTISYVDKEKLNRKAFVNVNTNNIPLHLLVTSLGLDYNAVDRVLKLNPQIKNPTFSFGNLKVYAE